MKLFSFVKQPGFNRFEIRLFEFLCQSKQVNDADGFS